MKRLKTLSNKIQYEDDIVVVYDNNDKIVYKDLFDYCPYKEDIYDATFDGEYYLLPQGYKAKAIEASKVTSSISPENPYELYKSDLNWHDDGNDSPSAPGATVEDPSMNDYIKGYKYDPYEMRYWAKIRKASVNPKQLMKIAWKEVDVLQFTPEYLADKIIKLWNQMDGTLQNAFEGFTLRYDNKLKQEIARIINERGYEVYPILLVDAPMYGVKLSKINKATQLIKICKKSIPTVATIHLANDLQYIQTNEHNLDIVNKKAQIMYDYYSQLFPEDYSLQLMKNYFKPFVDLQISDESLTQMEKMDSENQESLVLKDNGFDAYDFTSDMRYDTTAPNIYEVNNGTDAVYRLSGKLKKKIIQADDEDIEDIPDDEDIDENIDIEDTDIENTQEEDTPIPTFSMPNVEDIETEEEEETEIEYDNNNKIPNDLVFDVLNEATVDIHNFTQEKFLKPPVPVCIYIRYDNTTTPDSYSFESEVAVIDSLHKVYTVYEFFLSNRTNLFVIIQADRLTQDNKHYEWENIQYKGFYNTKQEAVNYVKGRL